MIKISNLRAIRRIVQFTSVTLLLVPAQLAWVIFAHDGRQSPVVRLWCRLTLKVFDGHVTLSSKDLLSNSQKIYLSNHISYVDMIVLGSLFDCFFVARADIAKWPFFGFLSRIAGTVFVSRSRHDIKKQISTLQNSLRSHKQLWIFPEGITSNGLQILPFKRSLLQAAEEAASDLVIQPVMIAYIHVNGISIFEQETADVIAWHGDMSFLPHLWNLLNLKNWQVYVEILPADPGLKEKGSKKLVADAEEMIRKSFHTLMPLPTATTLDDTAQE